MLLGLVGDPVTPEEDSSPALGPGCIAVVGYRDTAMAGNKMEMAIRKFGDLGVES